MTASDGATAAGRSRGRLNQTGSMRSSVIAAFLILASAPLAAQEESVWEVMTRDGIVSRETLPPPQEVDIGPPEPVDIPSRVVGHGPGRRIGVEQVVTAGSGGRVIGASFDGGIYSIEEDQAGDIWVGTGAGICRFDGQGWVTFTTSDGLYDDFVRDVTFATNGDMWLAHEKGVTQFDGERWIQHHLFGPQDTHVTRVTVGADGRVWTGGGRATERLDETANAIEQAVLLQYDGTDWWEYGEEQGLSFRASIQRVAVDKHGTVWMTQARVADGLVSLSGGTLTAYTMFAPAVLYADTEYDIITGDYSASSGVWYRLGQGHLGRLVAVARDTQGRLWLHTGESWGVLDGSRLFTYSWEDVRVWETVFPDSRGNAWLVGGVGERTLIRFRPSFLPTSIEGDAQRPQPTGIQLLPNYPNPFNQGTMVSFALSRTQPLSLQIFNSAGQVVDTLLDRPMSAGTHTQAWDGTDKANHPLGSGTYFCRLVTDGATAVRPLTLIK